MSIDWAWIGRHGALVVDLTRAHLVMALLPVAFGLLIAVPLGVVCSRFSRLYGPILGLTSVLYSIPSLVMFIVLIAYTGITQTTVIIALTIYTLSVLLRNVVDGIRSVPQDARDAAVGMGFGPVRRLLQVELPIAVPLIVAGARVATVSSISLVSVGALIGVSALGDLFTTYGIQLDFFVTSIVLGVVLIVALAVAADGVLVIVQRALTPWVPRGASR